MAKLSITGNTVPFRPNARIARALAELDDTLLPVDVRMARAVMAPAWPCGDDGDDGLSAAVRELLTDTRWAR